MSDVVNTVGIAICTAYVLLAAISLVFWLAGKLKAGISRNRRHG
jgi:hypothetical protein